MRREVERLRDDRRLRRVRRRQRVLERVLLRDGDALRFQHQHVRLGQPAAAAGLPADEAVL